MSRGSAGPRSEIQRCRPVTCSKTAPQSRFAEPRARPTSTLSTTLRWGTSRVQSEASLFSRRARPKTATKSRFLAPLRFARNDRCPKVSSRAQRGSLLSSLRTKKLASSGTEQVERRAEFLCSRFPTRESLLPPCLLVAVRELKRSQPRAPGEGAIRRVVLLRVPERAEVGAVEGHARVVAPAVVRVDL